MKSKKLEAIFGSRFLNNDSKQISVFYLGNRFLSIMASIIYLTKVNDMHTCYKIVRKRLLDKFNLIENGFDLDSEIVAKILKTQGKIREIPINYKPRSQSEGKKIKIKAGFGSLWILIKYRFKKW